MESQLTWSKAAWGILGSWKSEQDWEENAFLQRLDAELPGLGKQQRKLLFDAAAFATYHAEMGFPVVKALICDDASQFNWLARLMMLCWEHEGRSYKKLLPVVPLHREYLNAFLKRIWEHYNRLLAYRQKLTPEEGLRLEAEFDSLFALQTGCAESDKRIAKTRVKKDSLLLL
jgi:hypothetical protein